MADKERPFAMYTATCEGTSGDWQGINFPKPVVYVRMAVW